jgi:2-polyprenyl-3-methyl-5-hydroxy-6-metoxy-1,4-benzoquinol methylase
LNNDLVAYYKKRANEYEQIYSKPERQEDLKILAEILQEFYSGKSLVEIACGTGYWTERIAETARSIIATDINDSVIEIAQSKTYPNNNVTFKKQDLFSLNPDKKFDNLFGGFIWSHIKLQELDNFIVKVNDQIKENGTIMFIDNNYVEGSSSLITDEDEYGNTYQKRKLKDGSDHLVLKNFPSKDFIIEKFKGKAEEIKFINLKYYWMISYKNKRLNL